LADISVEKLESLIAKKMGDPEKLQSLIDLKKKGKKFSDADVMFLEHVLSLKYPPNSFPKTEKPDEEAIRNISNHLEPDEKVLEVATQSRFKPGGAFISGVNTIFATNKKIIIRNPTMLGMRESIEEIPYDQITSVKLEKGMFSSTILIRSPGLSELSRLSSSSGLLAWGRGEDGAIDALPSDKAERILKIIKNGMAEARKKKEQPTTVNQQLSVADELGKLAKLKEQGVLSEEEFAKMKNDLINKK